MTVLKFVKCLLPRLFLRRLAHANQATISFRAQNRLSACLSIRCTQYAARMAAAEAGVVWKLRRVIGQRVGHDLCGSPHPTVRRHGRQNNRWLLRSFSMLLPLLLLLPAVGAVGHYCQRRKERSPQRSNQNPSLRQPRRAFPAPRVGAARLTQSRREAVAGRVHFLWRINGQCDISPPPIFKIHNYETCNLDRPVHHGHCWCGLRNG